MALTPKQRLFIEYYCTTADFVAVKAASMAGYQNADRAGYELLKNSVVLDAIQKRLDTRAKAAFYSAEDIQRALWEEVNTKEGKGNTQAARVSALVWLGKSIGMWNELDKKAKLLEEQKKENHITYNIINYNEAQIPSREAIEAEAEENKQEVQHQLEVIEDVEIINYGE